MRGNFGVSVVRNVVHMTDEHGKVATLRSQPMSPKRVKYKRVKTRSSRQEIVTISGAAAIFSIQQGSGLALSEEVSTRLLHRFPRS